MWSSSFSSESYVRIVLLICRLTVIQSGKSSHNLWKNPGESFTLMSFSASSCVFWPLSRKKWGEKGGTKSAKSMFAECRSTAPRFCWSRGVWEASGGPMLRICEGVCFQTTPCLAWTSLVPQPNCSQSRLRIYGHIPASQWKTPARSSISPGANHNTSYCGFTWVSQL